MLLILLIELLLLFHCPCLEAFVYFKYKTPFQQLAQAVKMFYKSRHREKVAKVNICVVFV